MLLLPLLLLLLLLSTRQVDQGNIPGDAGVAISPDCKSYGTNVDVKMNVTVTAFGPGTSGDLSMVVTLIPDQQANVAIVDFQVYDPTGFNGERGV
jgi:hypothetical protein